MPLTNPAPGNATAQNVADASVAYFISLAVPGLQVIYQDIPWYIDDMSWQLAADLGWGAVAYFHIDAETESRITNASNGLQPVGQVNVVYDCSLTVGYKYLIPSGVATLSEDAWVVPVRNMMELLKIGIRIDPTFGTYPLGDARPIFTAGQGPAGQGPNIETTRNPPVALDEGTIAQWNQLRFQIQSNIIA